MHMDKKRMAWAEIDCGRIRENIRTIRNAIGPKPGICAVLKANAYGHGLREMAAFLSRNALVEMLAVGTLYEAKEAEQVLRRTGADMPILILCPIGAEEAEEALRDGSIRRDRTIFSVYSESHFQQLNQLGQRLGKKLRVHLRLDEWDSGMGIEYRAFLRTQQQYFAGDGTEVCGVYGHMYTSYGENREATRRELEAFDRVIQKIEPAVRSGLTVHVLNSPLSFMFPEYAYDMVRSGTAIYGLNGRDSERLQPIMRVCGRIFAVREVNSEAPLSYESSGRPGESRRIARVMLGFGDCPHLLTQPCLRAEIRGRTWPLADEPCMDQLCVDITGSEDIREGDTAVLLGGKGTAIQDVLEWNGVNYVHGDWMPVTTERMEKVLTEDA